MPSRIKLFYLPPLDDFPPLRSSSVPRPCFDDDDDDRSRDDDPDDFCGETFFISVPEPDLLDDLFRDLSALLILFVDLSELLFFSAERLIADRSADDFRSVSRLWLSNVFLAADDRPEDLFSRVAVDSRVFSLMADLLTEPLARLAL